jgi:catechol 2,3-dioxygenase-like lactoylglutathione lyase family enzyme
MNLFDHIGIKTFDLEATRRFYRVALGPLGVEEMFFVERPDGGVAGFGRNQAQFFVGSAPSPSQTPIHLAFSARSRDEVDAFHANALAAGGKDNGAPGVRPKYHKDYYAAFVLDPCGNNVEAVFTARSDTLQD